MCYHTFCENLRFKRVKGEIQNNRFYIWIYTKRKNEYMACFFRESFGNYKVFSGILRDLDGGCYKKCITRLMESSGIIKEKDRLEEIFRFDDSFIPIFHKIPVIVGFYENLSKKRMEISLQIYDKMKLFTLYGECPEDRYHRNDRATLDIRTIPLLHFSVEEEWIHKLPK